jgi:hypothetical protein
MCQIAYSQIDCLSKESIICCLCFSLFRFCYFIPSPFGNNYNYFIEVFVFISNFWLRGHQPFICTFLLIFMALWLDKIALEVILNIVTLEMTIDIESSGCLSQFQWYHLYCYYISIRGKCWSFKKLITAHKHTGQYVRDLLLLIEAINIQTPPRQGYSKQGTEAIFRKAVVSV